MPMHKFFHILCSNNNKVIYEGRFQCVTRSAALSLLREKVGRRNLTGLTYTITEFPIEVLKEIIDAFARNKKLPEGDIVPYQKQTIVESKTRNYASIRDHKRNPNKPTGSAGVSAGQYSESIHQLSDSLLSGKGRSSMNEKENKELEFYERRISNLEHTVYGNGRKGIKDELIELKTEIQTFRKMAVWQIGIAVAILAALLKLVF